MKVQRAVSFAPMVAAGWLVFGGAALVAAPPTAGVDAVDPLVVPAADPRVPPLHTRATTPPLAGLTCELPLRWRVGDIDPRFEISRDEAAGFIRRAGLLWEGAADRVLMFQESSDGIPVHFVFDGRQGNTVERRRLEEAVSERDREIEAGRREIEAIRARLESREIVHRARQTTFEERQRTYNEAVALWNRAGGAPAGERERLERQLAEVEQARQDLDASADELNAMIAEANALTARVNEQIRLRNEEAEAVLERFPASPVESGQFVDERRGLGRLTLTRNTAIRIFQFDDPEHLVRVIAHELGHALGLEHSGIDGTLMAEEIVSGDTTTVTEEDVELLRELCGAL